jgi:hypothetical protein
LRAAVVLATGSQGGIGDARLDVGQTQFAPLAYCITAFFSQGTVVARSRTCLRCATIAGGQVFAITIQCNGVVGGNFSAEADSTFGEARVVLEDSALDPVDTAISRDKCTIFGVLELFATLELFVGIPVTRGAR